MNNAKLRPVTSIDELQIGQAVRTRYGSMDWRVRRIDGRIVSIAQFTNDGRHRIDFKTASDIARGALRTYA